jgi:hypothetical protein
MRVQVVKVFVVHSSQASCYLFPLRPKYLPQHPVLERPDPMLFPNVRDKFLHTQICNSLF